MDQLPVYNPRMRCRLRPNAEPASRSSIFTINDAAINQRHCKRHPSHHNGEKSSAVTSGSPTMTVNKQSEVAEAKLSSADARRRITKTMTMTTSHVLFFLQNVARPV
jgi:hypothetical protein